jgi:hypothetical protein
MQVAAFVEHGLWLVTATVARAALSDSIAHCLVFEAAMKQRHAQALVLHGLDLEQTFGDFGIEGPKQRWLEDPAWQPARALVEELRNVRDFGEAIVAVNLCFEPLVGVLVRRDLLGHGALASRDPVTPAVVRAAQLEWDWTRAWTAAFARFVAADEDHGEANRDQLVAWVERWRPPSEEAATALEALGVSADAGRDFEPLVAAAGLASAEVAA